MTRVPKFLLMVFILAFINTSSVTKTDIIDKLRCGNDFYDSVTCYICQKSLFCFVNRSSVISNKEEIISQIETDIDLLMKNYRLMTCPFSPLHIFHDSCFIKKIKINKSCPECQYQISEQLYDDCLNPPWLYDFEFKKITKYLLICRLNMLTEEELFDFFKLIESNFNEDGIANFKEKIKKDHRFQQILRMLQIYESCKLDFSASISYPIYLETRLNPFQCITFRNSISSLTLEGILIFLEKLTEERSNPLAVCLLEQIEIILDEMKKDSFKVRKIDVFIFIKKIIDSDIDIRFFVKIFEKMQISEKFRFCQTSYIIKKCVDKDQIDASKFRTILDLIEECSDTFEFCDVEKMINICILNRVKNDQIATKASIFDYIFEWSAIRDWKQFDLVSFIEKYKQYDFICKSSSFMKFIIFQSEFGVLPAYLDKIIKLIVENELLKTNLIQCLINFKSRKIVLLCHLIHELLSKEKDEEDQKTIENLFNLIENRVYFAFNIIKDKPHSEKFMLALTKHCIKAKSYEGDGLKRFVDQLLCVTYNSPNLKYLTYYFLDGADLSMTKSQLLDAKTIDMILEQKLSAHKILPLPFADDSSLSFLFYTSYSNNLFKIAIKLNMSHITVMERLGIVNADSKLIKKGFLHFKMVGELIKIDKEEQIVEYAIKALAQNQDLIREYIEKNEPKILGEKTPKMFNRVFKYGNKKSRIARLLARGMCLSF